MNMMKKVSPYWHLEAEANEDRPGMNVYLIHHSGDCASLACADNEGETADGLRVPRAVVAAAFDWIEEASIDY